MRLDECQQSDSVRNPRMQADRLEYRSKGRLMRRWQGVWLGGGALLILGALALMGAGARSASGQGAAVMSLSPASVQANIGGNQIDMDVKIDNADNLGAFEFTLKFDSSMLEYVSMTGSNFLSTTGRVQQCIGPSYGPNGESPATIANTYGAFHFGCTTIGVSGNETKPGPSGSGKLAHIVFKTRGTAGETDIAFKGTGAAGDSKYVVRPADPNVDGDQGDTGFTGIADVLGNNPGASFIGAALQLNDPAAPEPTRVPRATPTPVSPQTDPDNIQATVTAVLGAPERRITDNASGATGGGDGGDGGGVSSVLGGRRGTSGPDVGASGSGAGGPSAAGSRAPNGAPIAGYGPQPQRPGWPGRVATLLFAVGTLALAAGCLRARVVIDRHERR
jgi:hypothetical protein